MFWLIDIRVKKAWNSLSKLAKMMKIVSQQAGKMRDIPPLALFAKARMLPIYPPGMHSHNYHKKIPAHQRARHIVGNFLMPSCTPFRFICVMYEISRSGIRNVVFRQSIHEIPDTKLHEYFFRKRCILIK